MGPPHCEKYVSANRSFLLSGGFAIYLFSFSTCGSTMLSNFTSVGVLQRIYNLHVETPFTYSFYSCGFVTSLKTILLNSILLWVLHFAIIVLFSTIYFLSNIFNFEIIVGFCKFCLRFFYEKNPVGELWTKTLQNSCAKLKCRYVGNIFWYKNSGVSYKFF